LEPKEEKFEEFVDSPLFRQRIKLDQIPIVEETKEEVSEEVGRENFEELSEISGFTDEKYLRLN
jgi:hypothetical protein